MLSDILIFLTTNPIWELLSMAVILVGMIWMCAYIVIWVVKKIKVKKMGNIELQDDAVLPNIKSKCIDTNDILLILRKQAEMMDEVDSIKHSVIPQQMRYAESKGADSRSLMQKTLLSLLEKKRLPDTNYVETQDYRIYWMCLRIIQEDMREFFRICFRENHLASKSDIEFRDYVHGMQIQIIHKTSDLLNELYRGEIVSRSELYEQNKSIIPTLQQHIAEILYHARDVARKAESEISLKKQAFELYFQHYMDGFNDGHN